MLNQVDISAQLEQFKQDISQQINMPEPDMAKAIFKITEYRQLLLSESDKAGSIELIKQHLNWLTEQVELITDLKDQVMTEITQLNRARKANASYDNNK